MNDANKFNFFIDIDLEKAEEVEKGTEAWYDNMIIKGVASTEDEDTDGETLNPNGFIIDRFLTQGLLNYEHQSKVSPRYIIGEPIEATIKDGKFLIKGKLWSKSETARDLWDTLHVMKDSGSNRKVGWSIEGKTLLRDPFNKKKIEKALITHCAITFSPKNANTWADIVKGNQSEDFVEYESDIDPNGGTTYILDVVRPDGYRVTVDTNFKIKVEKAMSAVSGSALIPESVNKKLIKLQPEIIKSINFLTKNRYDELFTAQIEKKIRKYLSI